MKKIQLNLEEMLMFVEMCELYSLISSSSIEKRLQRLNLKGQLGALTEEDCFIDVPDEDTEGFMENLTEMVDLFILRDEHQLLITKVKEAVGK